MKIETFLHHHGITENPFEAEEARFDPIFERIVQQAGLTHPDFPKILGRIDKPGTAIVFGEKGSGKTAIRLLIEERVNAHNASHPDRRVMLLPYDNLNPVLDQLIRRRRGVSAGPPKGPALLKILKMIRLEDHQDTILSLAITRINDAVLASGRDAGREAAPSDDSGPRGGIEPLIDLPSDVMKRIRQMDRRLRVEWAVLTALYDQPAVGNLLDRWKRLKQIIRPGWTWPASPKLVVSVLLGLAALVAGLAPSLGSWSDAGPPGFLQPLAIVLLVLGLVALGAWGLDALQMWRLSRRIRRETPAIDRTAGEIGAMLGDLKPRDLRNQDFPNHGDDDNARYELTARLVELLHSLDYVGVMVLVDRVDEPTLINGDTQRMQAVIWPMLDNKFLQQDRIGLKLLLPIELRHQVHKESTEFFQEARLDKQSLVDRLTWSGATLYDLCSARLRACQAPDVNPVTVRDLFASEVSRELLVDALDQMHQPRDAFKFLYAVLQEHCSVAPEDTPVFVIPKLTLEAVRKAQAQRVQELYRGLAPA